MGRVKPDISMTRNAREEDGKQIRLPHVEIVRVRPLWAFLLGHKSITKQKTMNITFIYVKQ